MLEAVDVRGVEIPTTTVSPAVSPLVIAAYWVVIRPTVTGTLLEIEPSAAITRTPYVPLEPTRAIAGTAITLSASAVVIETLADMPAFTSAGVESRVITTG